MNYIISIGLFVLKIIMHYQAFGFISPEEVFVLVSGLCLVVLTIRFQHVKYINVLMVVLSLGWSFYEPMILLVVIGISFNRYPIPYNYAVGALLVVLSVYHKAYVSIIFIPVLILMRYYIERYNETKDQLTMQLDNERKLRYDLEETKQKLIDSQQEIILLTEVHERNRIARDIHDKVGHQLTGTLLALETAKMMDDQEVKQQFIEKSYEQLSKGVEIVRETVHDISTQHKVGFSSLMDIVEHFDYCHIRYDHSGDVNSIPTHIYVVLIMNLKEALTNIMKYSMASNVNIVLEVTNVFIRMSISDDGKGAETINEGLGLSNMRQRLYGVNGVLSYHSHEGFKVVMYIKKGNS